MFLISYLLHDTQYLDDVRTRLALATPPMGLVTARSVPELIDQAQTLPVRAAMVDISWPRETRMQLLSALRHLPRPLPVLMLSPAQTDESWWQVADELARLDEPLDLFLYRLQHTAGERPSPPPTVQNVPIAPALEPPYAPTEHSLLETSQFRQFAEIFAGMEEGQLVESFTAWIQQACQTSRVVLLLRDPASGDFVCRAQRGLPSTLVPHCAFAQTAPLCRWLATSARILLKDADQFAAPDAVAELELMQAVAAVPVTFDGQLVGILGIGPRLVGQRYGASELEALFALGSQIAAALHHCRLHRTLHTQQEMTEHMLSVMPTGTLVLGAENRIVFANAAAAAILGKSRATLYGADMRVLPSPLGDLAYEALVGRRDLARREVHNDALGLPLAVTGYPLGTTPPSAMLLLEDLSARKRLEEEHDRRVNLEVLTNLVHYLAHELRNPLVALSTFSNLAPTRADDPDFKEFCDSVLRVEIGRVNLMLEQLLVLTQDVELQFHPMDLTPIFDRVTGTEEMRAAVVVSIPVALPHLMGDEQRLETALTCILRTATRLSYRQTPTTMKVGAEGDGIVISIEAPIAPGVNPERFLSPWQQFIDFSEEDIDLGLATAQYIVEQHTGTLHVSVAENVLTILCRLPLRADNENSREEDRHDAPQSARRRR